ncbi:MAG: SRPBCC domain-containing protein [Actinomycetota bacterium]
MTAVSSSPSDGTGCVLDVVKDRRFVWTSALEPGFRPRPQPEMGFLFTAIMDFEPTANGAIYRATARHMTAADAKTHAEVGFEQGWGAALDQLVALFS